MPKVKVVCEFGFGLYAAARPPTTGRSGPVVTGPNWTEFEPIAHTGNCVTTVLSVQLLAVTGSMYSAASDVPAAGSHPPAPAEAAGDVKPIVDVPEAPGVMVASSE